ncbi:Reverse transcriptase from transposon X-element protein [Ceratobasidium sp. AG-Ba]|nr:Reverse transcriptase from transposon X-element protein [Ceratobasidium sp. AG-Ba]
MLTVALRSSAARRLTVVPNAIAFTQRRTVLTLSKTVYTADATASGAGRNGKTELDDGSMSVNLASPKEMGGSGNGQNPEQLFALGYSSRQNLLSLRHIVFLPVLATLGYPNLDMSRRRNTGKQPASSRGTNKPTSPDPEELVNPGDPYSISTSQAREILAQHITIHQDDATDLKSLLRILSDTLRREEITSHAAAIFQGVVALIHSALGTITRSQPESELEKKLDSVLEKLDVMTGQIDKVHQTTPRQHTTQMPHSILRPPPPRTATEPSLHDLKEADARIELRAREVLLEPTTGRESLKNLDANTIVNMATSAVAKASRLVPNGPEILIRAVHQLPRGGARLVLNTSEAANWLCSADPANMFEKAFGGIKFYGHYAQILVQMMPIHLDITSNCFLRTLEAENCLGEGAIIQAEWMCPEHRRKEDQRVGHIKITLRSNEDADHLIRQYCYSGGAVYQVKRLDSGPIRCTKCQNYGHRRAKCKSEKTLCSRCGGEHEDKRCDNRHSHFCIPCQSANHPSYARSCPVFQRETAILNAKRPENTRRLFNERCQDRVSYVPYMAQAAPPLQHHEPRRVTFAEGAQTRHSNSRREWSERQTSPAAARTPSEAPDTPSTPQSSPSRTLTGINRPPPPPPLVAKNKGVKLSEDVKIKAAVSIGEASGGFGIGVELTAIGADAALVHEAHTVCPYSRILAQGAEVKLNVK